MKDDKLSAKRLARVTVDRFPQSNASFRYAIVSTAPYAAPSGESVIDVTIGDPPNQLAYPLIRFAAGMAPVVNDKVLLLWLGTDPVAIVKLAP